MRIGVESRFLCSCFSYSLCCFWSTKDSSKFFVIWSKWFMSVLNILRFWTSQANWYIEVASQSLIPWKKLHLDRRNLEKVVRYMYFPGDYDYARYGWVLLFPGRTGCWVSGSWLTLIVLSSVVFHTFLLTTACRVLKEFRIRHATKPLQDKRHGR